MIGVKAPQKKQYVCSKSAVEGSCLNKEKARLAFTSCVTPNYSGCQALSFSRKLRTLRCDYSLLRDDRLDIIVFVCVRQLLARSLQQPLPEFGVLARISIP